MEITSRDIMKSRNQWYVNIVAILVIIAVLSKGNKAGVCEFCGKDFTVLGRHQWRCKARTFTTVTIDYIPGGSDTYSTTTSLHNANNRAIENETSSLVHHNDSDHNGETAANNEPVVEPEENNHNHQCYCGKSFKTFRGLNSHKRSCHVLDIPNLKSLFEVSLQGTSDDIEESNEEDEEIDLDKLSLLTGVKLPKRDSDWQNANDYFKIMVEPETLTNENINTYVRRLQETIHRYFKEQYGNVLDTQSHELFQRYDSGTKSKLKKNLSDLKKSYETNQNDILLNEIKYVSKVLREKFSKRSNSFESFDHNKRSEENLWKYCKDIFENESKIQPEFSEDECHSYFRNSLKTKNRHKKFTYPRG